MSSDQPTDLRAVRAARLSLAPAPQDATVRELLASGNTEIFRRLVDNVRDYAIFLLTPDGTIASWNSGAQLIKGYAADEIVGRHFSQFYEPGAVARGWPAEELQRATALGRFEDEGWRVRKDGSRFWANVVITALHDAYGRLIGFSKVTRDLTERRRFEQELQQREENMRLLVEGVKDHAMFVLDSRGRVQSWNYGAQRLLGYEAHEALGVTHAALYTAEDRAAGRPEAELAAAAAAGFASAEGWRRRSDGSAFWADAALNVLHDELRGVRGYVCIVHDLSERKRVEELEGEGRRLNEFIAMLSHELRNPLAPIHNAVTILKRSAQSPDAAWCLDVVSRQVGQLSRLVDDLLDVSRVTSGKIRLETGPLELNTLVRMAAEAARPALAEQRHVLSLQLWPRAVPIVGDPVRLTQVLSNLLNNAVKYTPQGGRIEVAVRAESKLVALQVKDNGIGMTESLLRRAFEPFVQGERTLDRAQGGMGIGLTLVRRIVELHGGSVTAASAGVGKGSTVTVVLPVAPAVELPSEPSAPAPTRAARRVLLVDDNVDAAESLATLLRLSGHDVQVAYDGAQALSVAAALRPSVVLLDIGLPGMDGYEVARRLKALPGLAAVKLIALTGYSQESDRQAAAEAGFVRHLAKPVDFDELCRMFD